MKRLFEKVELSNITLKNRIVRSATASGGGDGDGFVNEKVVEPYIPLLNGGVGLIFTGHMYVAPDGRAGMGQIGIYDDNQISGLSHISRAGKQSNVCIIPQISHAGYGKPAAEANPEHYRKAFVDAAVRAKKAGFEGVQLHCAHYYGLSRFISISHNNRTDIYGGSVENRWRLPSEIITEIKDKCGDNFAVFIKINGNDNADDTRYRDEFVWICNDCKRLGVEAVEISGDPPIQDNHPLKPFFIDRAAYVAKHTDEPLILVGGLRTKEDIVNALDYGMTMLSFSRPFTKYPDFPNKLRENENITLY